jgi:hypothetical protein
MTTSPGKRPGMTDAEYREAVDRVLDRLDHLQAFDKNMLINAQQIRDLLDPRGLWSCSQYFDTTC